MKLFTSVILAIVAIGFSACDSSNTPVAPSTPAVNKVVDNLKGVGIYGYFYNECCDEFVEVLGTGNIVVRENGVHFLVKSLAGTGSNGNSYTQRGASTQNSTTTNNPDGSTTYHTTLNVNMVNADGCSFKLHVNVKTTVDAEGNVTVVYEKITFDCE